MGTIVVGVDESDAAAEALRWAVWEGDRRSWDVTAMLCWGDLHQHHAAPDAANYPGYSAHAADRAIEEIVRRVLGDEAARVQYRAVHDRPARGLLSASADVDLLVLGDRGRGALQGTLLGSVSRQCLHHANLSVAIVRRRPHGPHDAGRVVVGIDGSDGARHALDWALDEVRARKSTLTIVHTLSPPFGGGYVPVPAYDVGPYIVGNRSSVARRVAEDLLDNAIAAADTSDLHAPIERRVVSSPAGAALVEAAGAADLLVVGSRGLGGFSGLLLGSVSNHVAHRAPCPVVVVRPAA